MVSRRPEEERILNTEKHASFEPLFLAALGGGAALLPLFASAKMSLGIVFGLGLVVMILRNPHLGLYLIAGAIPLETAGHIGELTRNLPLTIPKIITAVTVLSWGVNLAQRRVRVRQAGWMHLVTLFLLAAFLSLAGASEVRTGFEAVFRFSTTVVFFFLVVQLADSPARIRRCLVVFVIASTVAASISVSDRFLSSSRFEFRHGWEENQARRGGVERDIVERHMVGVVERSSGLSVHSILLSLNVSLVLPLAVAILVSLHPRNPLRLLWLFFLGILLCSVVASYARTGMILVVFSGALMLWRRILRLTPLLYLCLVTLVVLVLLLAPARYFDRVFSPDSYTLKSRSIVTRLEVLDAAWHQFLDHPFRGVGYGNRYGIFDYYTTYPDKKHAVSPHNAYVQVAAQVGIAGLFLLTLFFWKVHRNTRRAAAFHRREGDREVACVGEALDISILTFLFSGLALDLFDKGMPHAWLLIGLAASFSLMAPAESAPSAGREPFSDGAFQSTGGIG